jgi:hypothetical protein
MSVNDILASIDKEIERLEQARKLLAPLGRKKRSSPVSPKAARKRRALSAEGRKRIADAQRLRWAKQKKTATKA